MKNYSIFRRQEVQASHDTCRLDVIVLMYNVGPCWSWRKRRVTRFTVLLCTACMTPAYLLALLEAAIVAFACPLALLEKVGKGCLTSC